MNRSTLSRLSVLSVLLAGACDSPVRPGDPDPPRPSLLVSDGAHNGNPHFYFLPPMVPAPAHTGIPDGTHAPAVEVCDIGTATPSVASACLSSPVATFSRTSGSSGEVVRYDEQGKHYIVTWKTDQSVVPLQSGRYYRIHVRVAGTLLGFADVTPVDNGAALRHYTTGDVIALVNGRTLPIKFRIEVGAVYVVEPPPPGAPPATVTSTDGVVTMQVPPGAISEPLGITIQPASVSAGTSTDGLIAGTAYHFGPTGTAFAAPITVTVAYNPAAVPATRGAASLRLVTLVDGNWVVIPGSTVDPATQTVSAPLSHFSTFAVQSIRRLAVSVIDEDDHHGRELLFLIYEDGTGPVYLNWGRSPAWSPDGTQIAYLWGNTIAVIAPDGSGNRQLPGTESNEYTQARLSWSPDGREIAFDAEARLIKRVAADGLSEPITVFSAEFAYTPNWSAARNQIAFAGDWEEGVFDEVHGWLGISQLYLINPDGTGRTRLTDTPDRYEWSPVVNADGTKIVYAFQQAPWFFNEPMTIGILDLETNTSSIVIDGLWSSLGGDEDLYPTFTPSGKISFYSRGPVGNRNDGSIWVINPDGTDLTRLITNEMLPTWFGSRLKLAMIESWEP